MKRKTVCVEGSGIPASKAYWVHQCPQGCKRIGFGVIASWPWNGRTI